MFNRFTHKKIYQILEIAVRHPVSRDTLIGASALVSNKEQALYKRVFTAVARPVTAAARLFTAMARPVTAVARFFTMWPDL